MNNLMGIFSISVVLEQKELMLKTLNLHQRLIIYMMIYVNKIISVFSIKIDGDTLLEMLLFVHKTQFNMMEDLQLNSTIGILVLKVTGEIFSKFNQKIKITIVVITELEDYQLYL